MAQETEVERLVVRLMGDASDYEKTLDDSVQKSVQAVMRLEEVVREAVSAGKSLRDGLDLSELASSAIENYQRAVQGLAEMLLDGKITQDQFNQAQREMLDAAQRADAVYQEAMQRIEDHNKLMEDGRRLTRSLMTEEERREEVMQRVSRLYEEGAISLETYNRALEASLQHADMTGQIGKLGDAISSLGYRVTAVSAIAGGAILVTGRSVVRSFSNAEMAEARLRAALEGNNRQVERVMRRYKAFAAEVQDATMVSDDAAISLLGLAESMGLTERSAERAVRNAIALASTGQIGEMRALRLAAALEYGSTTGLSRYVPALKAVEDESLRVAVAQRELEKMHGRAAAMTQTVQGASRQFANELDNLKEEYGELISQGLKPALVWMRQWIKSLQDARGSLKQTVVGVGGFVAAVSSIGSAIGGSMIYIGNLIQSVLRMKEGWGLLTGLMKSSSDAMSAATAAQSSLAAASSKAAAGTASLGAAAGATSVTITASTTAITSETAALAKNASAQQAAFMMRVLSKGGVYGLAVGIGLLISYIVGEIVAFGQLRKELAKHDKLNRELADAEDSRHQKQLRNLNRMVQDTEASEQEKLRVIRKALEQEEITLVGYEERRKQAERDRASQTSWKIYSPDYWRDTKKELEASNELFQKQQRHVESLREQYEEMKASSEKALTSQRKVESAALEMLRRLEEERETLGMTDKELSLYELNKVAKKEGTEVPEHLRKQIETEYHLMDVKKQRIKAEEEAAAAIERAKEEEERVIQDAESRLRDLEFSNRTRGLSSARAELIKLREQGVPPELLHKIKEQIELEEALEAAEKKEAEALQRKNDLLSSQSQLLSDVSEGSREYFEALMQGSGRYAVMTSMPGLPEMAESFREPTDAELKHIPPELAAILNLGPMVSPEDFGEAERERVRSALKDFMASPVTGYMPDTSGAADFYDPVWTPYFRHAARAGKDEESAAVSSLPPVLPLPEPAPTPPPPSTARFVPVPDDFDPTIPYSGSPAGSTTGSPPPDDSLPLLRSMDVSLKTLVKRPAETVLTPAEIA